MLIAPIPSIIKIPLTNMRIKTLFVAALAACACLIALLLLHRYRLEAQLLRADPAAIPRIMGLMSFARGRGEALYSARCATCHGVGGRGDSARGIPSLRDDDWLYGTGSISDIEQIITYGIRSYNPKAWNLAIMPAYATPRPSARDDKISPLSPANIRDVVEFLLQQRGRARDAAQGGDASRGREDAQGRDAAQGGDASRGREDVQGRDAAQGGDASRGREDAQGRDAAQARDADKAAVARGAALFSGAGGCYDCHAPDAKGDPGIGAPNLVDGVTLYGDGSREALTLSIAYGRAGMCPAWIKRISPAGIRELAVYVYALSRAAPGCRGTAC